MALFVAALAIWVVYLRPTWLGGPAGYVVVAGDSMLPTYSDGTLVVTSVAAGYGPGDVVAFAVDVGDPVARPLVIHRIAGGDAEDGYVTQGDNRPFTDPWITRPADILGRPMLTVPGAGQFLLILRSPIVIASISAGAAVYIVLGPPRTSRRTAVKVPKAG
jgi:signal peptidase